MNKPSASVPGLDWVHLGTVIGQQGGGTAAAEQALEHLVGRDTIEAAVDVIVAFGPGWELAERVLVHLRSRWALEYAYSLYQTTTGEQKRLAVRLIMHLAHRETLAWIPAFLKDADVAAAGIDVVDHLIFAGVVDPESNAVETLLAQAEHHVDEYVQQKAAYIRAYIQADADLAELQQAYYDSHGTPSFPPDPTP